MEALSTSVSSVPTILSMISTILLSFSPFWWYCRHSIHTKEPAPDLCILVRAISCSCYGHICLAVYNLWITILLRQDELIAMCIMTWPYSLDHSKTPTSQCSGQEALDIATEMSHNWTKEIKRCQTYVKGNPVCTTGGFRLDYNFQLSGMIFV